MVSRRCASQRSARGAPATVYTTRVRFHLIARFRASPLLSGTVVLFLGTVGSGFINYVFNIVIARERWLGPVDYGTLAALFSSLTLVSLIGTVIATVMTSYTASFIARGQRGSVGRLVAAIQRRVIRYGIPALILLAGSSRLLAGWFHLENIWPIMLLLPLILLTLLFQALAGALQGLLAFGSLALVSVGGAGLRLFLALAAVLIGWRVAGVLLAGLLAQLMVYGIAYWPLRPYLAARLTAPPLPRRDIVRFGGPVFIAVLGITAFFTIDIILAKHYLSPAEAGLYSGLSILARVVYFAALPFIQVMFPVVSQAAVQRHSSRATAGLTLGATLLIAGLVSLIYFTRPQLVITLSIGPTYLPAQAGLGWLAICISGVSVAAWLIHYLLAHQNARAVWAFPAVAVLQVVLITRYHANLDQIIWSSLAASSLLLVGLAAYTAWWLLQSRQPMQRFEPAKTL